MRIVQAARASTILYGLISNRRHDEIWLLPANICPIVPITFLKARVPFRFVDISPQTLSMDLEMAEAQLKKQKFGGLLYAHTYGDPLTPDDFFESIRIRFPELLIVDDLCLCVPALQESKSTHAHVQLYSTGYSKMVDLGFGGYAFLDDIPYEPAHLIFEAEHYQRIEKAYKATITAGTKFTYEECNWLDTTPPALSWPAYQSQITARLAETLKHRKLLNEIYSTSLPAEIQFAKQFQMWRFNIKVKNKQQIMEKIFSSGLFASSHYASLAGIMDDGTAVHAEALAKTVINLFNDQHFTSDQAQEICRVIRENLS